MRYAFIRVHVQQWTVKTMCRVLEVSKAGYYAWRARGQSERSKRDAELVQHIHEAHVQSRKIYGSPRIYAELRRNGVRTSRKRVANLMREHRIQGGGGATGSARR